jgi:hypothetical protein
MSTPVSISSKEPLTKRLWSFCFALEPMRHAWWELLIFRFVIAWCAWDTLAGPSRFHSQPVPHGIAAWGVDFSWLGSDEVAGWLVPLIAICLTAYLLLPLIQVRLCEASSGSPWRSRAMDWLGLVVLTPPLIASFGHGVLGNSQGAIGHTTQIVTSVLFAQWLGLAWGVLCSGKMALPHGYNSQQFAADLTRQIIAASYVASALTKLWLSSGNWLKETPYFGLQIAKATGQAYYEWLQPPDNAAWLAQFLIDHPWFAAALIGAGLPLELLVFVGLRNRRAALFFGVALAAFHCSVTEIMHLGFAYHKLFMFWMFGNAGWWIMAAVARLTGRHITTNTGVLPSSQSS